MTPFWIATSVSYFHDTLTSSIPQRDLLLADEIPRINRGMTVKYVLAAKRYRGSMT
ncbi:hypothetical protein [Wolbachia endosymbiont of Aedes albopictus]|uniref:hypothetical protein n=1 Tax=Wolbachia endosymbiont of Aedes albopictus TaxID=167957 RepID=UPI002166ECB1|nr:hypothetical protein [Wolbachia endosymbiont of Aedes albopictus]UVW83521.1 hypothetical protein NHG98_04020 [Wolbachia endosymbiont of Aedes albopictus]